MLQSNFISENEKILSKTILILLIFISVLNNCTFGDHANTGVVAGTGILLKEPSFAEDLSACMACCRASASCCGFSYDWEICECTLYADMGITEESNTSLVFMCEDWGMYF